MKIVKTLTILCLFIFVASFMLFTPWNREQLIQNNKLESYTETNYKEMMYNFNSSIDFILSESKPQNMSLESYKIKLLNGDLKISVKQENKIINVSEIRSNCGKYLT
jgi:uncharacterized membrane protein